MSFRIRDDRHLRYVQKQDCAADVSQSANGHTIPGSVNCNHETVVPHHIMYAEPSAMSLKTGDNWTVPLCHQHHAELHKTGDEKLFWALRGIDPMQVAQRLWSETINYRAKTPIVQAKFPPKTPPKPTRSTKILGTKAKDA